mmetsp:Transcript_34372/g.93085  ORF Transcript_34372/g.93085 Transcript_34372/m.93085 type:complete len:233 (+) Transcript_34372:741-1439(+)
MPMSMQSPLPRKAATRSALLHTCIAGIGRAADANVRGTLVLDAGTLVVDGGAWPTGVPSPGSVATGERPPAHQWANWARWSSALRPASKSGGSHTAPRSGEHSLKPTRKPSWRLSLQVRFVESAPLRSTMKHSTLTGGSRSLRTVTVRSLTNALSAPVLVPVVACWRRCRSSADRYLLNRLPSVGSPMMWSSRRSLRRTVSPSSAVQQSASQKFDRSDSTASFSTNNSCSVM